MKEWESLLLLGPGKPGRPGSPALGFSILTTSAPRKASASVQDGPASNWVRSSTRTPARQSPSAACACTIVSFIEQPSRSGVLADVPANSAPVRAGGVPYKRDTGGTRVRLSSQA